MGYDDILVVDGNSRDRTVEIACMHVAWLLGNRFNERFHLELM